LDFRFDQVTGLFATRRKQPGRWFSVQLTDDDAFILDNILFQIIIDPLAHDEPTRYAKTASQERLRARVDQVAELPSRSETTSLQDHHDPVHDEQGETFDSGACLAKPSATKDKRYSPHMQASHSSPDCSAATANNSHCDNEGAHDTQDLQEVIEHCYELHQRARHMEEDAQWSQVRGPKDEQSGTSLGLVPELIEVDAEDQPVVEQNPEGERASKEFEKPPSARQVTYEAGPSAASTLSQKRERLASTGNDTEGTTVVGVDDRMNSKRRRVSSDDNLQESVDTIVLKTPSTQLIQDKKRNQSKRATRTMTTNEPLPTTSTNNAQKENVKVFFSNSTTFDQRPFGMKKMRELGVMKTTDMKRCDYFCIREGVQLTRSYHLLLAVVLGKDIVTEEWLSKSVDANALLDHADYLVEDPVREKEWGTTLAAAVSRGKDKVKVLQGYGVAFTAGLQRQLGSKFEELRSLAWLAGAKSVTVHTEATKVGLIDCIICAREDDGLLGRFEELSIPCYSKEIITLSILRGKLNIESDEFRRQRR
jgi:hypothetical protein